MMYVVFFIQKGFCFCTISNPVISFSGSTDHSRGKQNGVSSFGNAGRVRSYWFCVIHSITKTSTPRGVCNKLWDPTALWVSCTWPPFVAGSEWRKLSKFSKIFSMNNEKNESLVMFPCKNFPWSRWVSSFMNHSFRGQNFRNRTYAKTIVIFMISTFGTNRSEGEFVIGIKFLISSFLLPSLCSLLRS